MYTTLPFTTIYDIPKLSSTLLIIDPSTYQVNNPTKMPYSLSGRNVLITGGSR